MISPSVRGCQGQAGYIRGVARLGIPPLRLTDGPAGVRLGHVETALPAPVGLAASFDRTAAYDFGAVLGAEGRATNQDVMLAPMTNQVAIPTAGRNFETLGEDPYLMAELLPPAVKGVQDQGLIATLKHYAMNDFENGRNSTSVKIDEQSLREMELVGFKSGVDAGAGAIMCAYNRVNDVYACSSNELQNQFARDDWGYQGWIMSDWGATHRTSDLIYGLDMAMPNGTTGNGWGDALLQSAMTNGTAAVPLTNDFPMVPAYSAGEWKAALDKAVFRILSQMNNAGLLEGTVYGTHYTDGTPYVPHRPDLLKLQHGSFAKAQAIAEDSATLLKNDEATLPLRRSDLIGKGVLVMGPTAIAPYVGGGGSAHVRPYDPVEGPYAALLRTAGSDANISYVPGYDLDGAIVPASALTAPDTDNPYPYWTLRPEDAAFSNQPGLLRQQITTESVPSGTQPKLYEGPDAAPDRLDAGVDYTGTNTLPAGTAWRWTGVLTPPGSGSWRLKIFVANQAGSQLFTEGLATGNRRINIGGYPVAPSNSYATLAQTARSHDPAAPDLQQATYTVNLTPGQPVHLDLRAVFRTTGPGKIQFRWIPADLGAVPASVLNPPGEPGVQGLRGEYFNNMTFAGDPVLTRVDSQQTFNWGTGSPDPSLPANNFSVRWTGTLTAPVTGDYVLGTTSDDGSRLYVDDQLLVDNWGDHAAQSRSATIHLEAGQSYPIRLEYYENGGDALMTFDWREPGKLTWQQQKIDEAVAAAREANKVVVFAYDEGTEGSDRGGNNPAAGMVLPGYQDALISAVAAANPNTVVVLNTGDPVLMPWADDVAAVLEMWYPGQRGGAATARVLLGKVNPSGKLPVTFPAEGTSYPQYDPGCTDTSLNGNCPLYPGKAELGFLGQTNHGYRSIDFTKNGIFVGYRWYDKHGVEPQFAFGHGLSYTQFAYSHLVVKPAANGGLDVSFQIRNTGDRAGTEVPQAYIGPSSQVPDDVQQAERKLVQFDRVTLSPGQAHIVRLSVSPQDLSYWSTDLHAWALGTGSRTLYVGSASDDLRLQTTVEVTR